MAGVAVVAFPFGTADNTLANILIMRIANANAVELCALIFSKTDIGVAPEFYCECDEGGSIFDPTTLHIACEAVRWAKAHDITELWVSAAYPHLARCIRDLRYVIQKLHLSMNVKFCHEIERYPDSVWFSGKSKNFYARSKQYWNIREFFVSILPYFIYK